ncbi:hypothetical protein TNCV_143191 [Trichonephila clavipes]|nr:hypothetical protein TNCV_143191 [Trichonephila clavipes]
MPSKGCTQLDTRCKGQFLKDDCWLFAWKFYYQTQQEVLEKADDPLIPFVAMRLMPSSDPMQMSMLCGDLG